MLGELLTGRPEVSKQQEESIKKKAEDLTVQFFKEPEKLRCCHHKK
jgi:hypothetical protein